VPLPDVLSTATASRGLLALMSYTLPEMVTNCAYKSLLLQNMQAEKQQRKMSSFFFKPVN